MRTDPDLVTCSNLGGCPACIDPSGATILLTDRWARLTETVIPAHGCGWEFSATGIGSPCPRRGVIKEGEGENLVALRCVIAHHK